MGTLDASSGVWTTNVPGIYMVTWSLQNWVARQNYNKIFLHRNGNRIGESEHYSYISPTPTFGMYKQSLTNSQMIWEQGGRTMLLRLNARDTLSLRTRYFRGDAYDIHFCVNLFADSSLGKVVQNLKTELREVFGTVADLKQHEQEMEEAYEVKVKALEEKVLSQEANLATNEANAKAFEAMVANKIQTNKDNIASTGVGLGDLQRKVKTNKDNIASTGIDLGGLKRKFQTTTQNMAKKTDLQDSMGRVLENSATLE